MKKRITGSILTLLAGAGLSVAQTSPMLPSMKSTDAPSSAPSASADAAKPSDKQAEQAGYLLQRRDRGPAISHSTSCAGVELPDEPNAFDGETCPKEGLFGQRCSDCTHFWLSAEGLWWREKKGSTPALVTTNTAGGLGALGEPGTVVLIGGGNSLDYGDLGGARFSIGYSGENEFNTQTCGFEASGFFFNKKSTHQAVQSDAFGNPTLSRPIFDPLQGIETVQRVALAGAFAGGVAVDSTSRLWGAEANLLMSRMLWGPDIILGARYIDLTERLGISQMTTVLGNGIAGFNGETLLAGSTIGIQDSFSARNQFYGGQVGLQNEYHGGPIFLFAQAKVALGETHEHGGINGSTTAFRTDGTVSTTSGGLLAVSSNIGTPTRDRFSIVPEFNINVGVDITRWCRVFAGYSLLYWTDVTRPGGMIDHAVNPALIPYSLQFGLAGGPNVPAQTMHATDFWAQGVNFGVAFRY